MSGQPTIHWKRIGIEGAAIIVSILLAFWIDAWWEDRQLENEVAEDLAIVEFELAENVRLVQSTMDIMREVIAANNALLAELETPEAAEVVEVDNATLFWALFSNPTYDPSLGGIDAWIAAGRLAGLKTPALRQRLASIRGKVSDIVEEQIIAREIGVREIYPLLKDGIGDLSTIQELFSDGLHARYKTSVQAVSDSGKIAVPNSNALRFLLRARVVWYEASIHETGDFQAELEEIQQLLRAEIKQH